MDKPLEVSIPISGTITPEGQVLLDRMYWDAWAADVQRVIDAGDIIPACAHTLQMARYAVSVQLSDYGANTVKRVINSFWVKYRLEAGGVHANNLGTP